MKSIYIGVLFFVSLFMCLSSCNKDDDKKNVNVEEQESNSSSYKAEVYRIEKDDKVGFIDKNGEIVIEPKYDCIDKFCYGLAYFRTKGTDGYYHNYGFMNTKGEVVIKEELRSASQFTEDGLARAIKNDKSGYIDRTGKMVFEANYESKGDFQEGLASVKISGKYGFINTSGTLTIEPKFKSVGRFCNDYCLVNTMDGLYNFIDKSGNLISKIGFKRASWFYCGIACVKIDDKKYRYIHSDGEFAFDGQFDDAESFSEGLAAVKNEEGKWGFINTKGELVLDYKYETGWFSSLSFHEGLAYVQKDGLWGYIDKTGVYVISPRYKSANKFVNGVARVYLVEKSAAYINRNGDIIYKGSID